MYQLFKGGERVYIGKTDSDAGLKARLKRHSQKVQGRQNLPLASITFKAIRIFVFSAMDLEDLLIKHYSKISDLPWQNSGFGSNDPGRNRDTTKVKATHWDALYPIDLNLQVTIVADSKTLSVAKLLVQIKKKLPFLLRYERAKGKTPPHQDLQETNVTISSKTDSVDSFFRQIKAVIGAEWQFTVFPGHVILYKESKEYASATYYI